MLRQLPLSVPVLAIIPRPARSLVISFLGLLVAACAEPQSTEQTAPTDQSESSATDASATTPADAQTSPLTEVAPGAIRSDFIGPLRDAYDRIDPTNDGWETEAFSAAALDQLHLLESLLLSPETISEEALAAIAVPELISAPLRPDNLSTIFSDSQLTVKRLEKTGGERLPAAQGTPAFLELLRQFAEGNTPETARVQVKIIRVEPLASGQTNSEVMVTLHREGADSRVQINTLWRCGWLDSGDAPPRLTEIEVTRYEEILQASSGTSLFEDATDSVLGGNSSYANQFLVETDQWRAQLPRDLGIDPVANHGLAIGDVNGDELDDLYICQQGGLPNRLFIQQPDGTLTDVSEGSGADWLDYCSAALLVDFDNDGDRDLIITQDFRMLVMSNDGNGKFTLEFEVSTAAQSFSLAAADYDNDSLVDVYICGYNPPATELRGGTMGEPMPFHDANNGGASQLWRNTGSFKFEDVTSTSGIDQHNTRFTFAAAWEDFDNDGDQDLYVANDYGRNCLYQNSGGSFTDIAPQMGVEDTSSGMSVSWSDFNNDGLMDIYTSNMFSSAGNRITFQRQFKAGVADEIREQFQHIAQGNSLFQATPGSAPFKDVGGAASVQMGRWAWGSSFVDFNNDGLDDILVANGFISTRDTSDL